MSGAKVTHSLSPDELVKALAATAIAEGIGEELAETLEKAHGEEGPVEPIYPAAKTLVNHWRQIFVEAQDWVIDEAGRILGINLVVAKSFSYFYKSAVPAQITAQQLHKIQEAVRAKFGFISVQMQGPKAYVTQQMLDQWKKLGLIKGNVTLQNFGALYQGEPLIQNAFVFGRLYKALEKGGSYEEVMKLALDMPLKAPDLAAIAYAEKRAASAIQGIGEKVAASMTKTILERERQAVREMTVKYFEGMKPTVKDARIPFDESRTVDTWKGFSRELRLNMDDQSRDWDRVAFYETQDALANGKARELVERDGAESLVYKQPRPSACPQCIALYLNPDGTPKYFTLRELIANGDNVGRKPMPTKKGAVIATARLDGADTYRPVVGQTHPWCQCILVSKKSAEWF